MSFINWTPLRGLLVILGILALPVGTARADDVRTLVVPNASVADGRADGSSRPDTLGGEMQYPCPHVI